MSDFNHIKVFNEFSIKSVGVSISNFNAKEYGIALNNGSALILRILDNKLIEFYCNYMLNGERKIVSIDNNGLISNYHYKGNNIYRDDGVVYTIRSDKSISRTGDSRIYLDAVEYNLSDIPDILYVICYFVNDYLDSILKLSNEKISIEFAKDIIDKVNSNVDNVDIIKLVKNNSEVKNGLDKQEKNTFCQRIE